MLSNRFALLEYDVGGPVVVHERMVLDHIASDEYVVCTPDRDLYVEQLSVDNPDLRSFRMRPTANRLPPGVAAGDVYALPAWTQAELTAIRDEARQIAQAELARRGGAVAAPAVVVGAPAQVAQAAAGVPAVPRCPGVTGLTAGVLVWVAAEAIEGVQYGDVIDNVVAPMVLDGKTVHQLPDGRPLFCMCVNDSRAETFNNRPSLCDGRLLPRKMNSLGSPEMTLTEAVTGAKEFDLGWKLSGPRTSRWCLNYLTVEGLGLEGHHERFRQICKLDSGSWGVQEHFQLSVMLRNLLQSDGFDGCNSIGIEMMFRRIQTIEYSHAERARESESRALGGNSKLALEEQFVFGSLVRTAGTLMICPALLQHVKEETEREVLLAKNLRKAKEERELAAKSKSKSKKQEEGP